MFRSWGKGVVGKLLFAEKLVRVFFGDDTRVNIGRREITVDLKLEKDREELMEQVRTVGLPEKLPEGIQLPLEEQP